MSIAILIASPSSALRGLLVEYLSQAGYDCLEADSPEATARQAEAAQLLILDRSAPTAAWEKLLSDIQQPPSFARIFLIRGEPPPGMISLALPLRLGELGAAIQRALRPLPAAASQAGPLLLWPGIHLLVNEKLLQKSGGTQVELTEKECSLLLRLLAAEGENVPREQLLQAIWGYSENIDTHTLETHIYRLRSKIKKITGSHDGIDSQPGGYALKTG